MHGNTAEKTEVGTTTPAVAQAASPYMTVDQAAAYLKTTHWAIAQAIRAGDLQAKKVGKRFVTTVRSVDDWYSRQRDAT
jgi:excisionase family DNA binding protein